MSSKHLSTMYGFLGGCMNAIIIWVEAFIIHMIQNTIGNANMLGADNVISFFLMICNCFYDSESNGVRLEEMFQLFDLSKYPQEGPQKESIGSFELIIVAHNAEEEVPLNSIPQLWSKIFHLPYMY